MINTGRPACDLITIKLGAYNQISSFIDTFCHALFRHEDWG